MLPLLGIGERHHPQLDAVFLEQPDTGGTWTPGAPALKDVLGKTDRELWRAFSQWSPADWLSKHSAVSDEEFAREPHRNRLSVVLSRNSHLAFHHGQIVLTQPRG